jgi:hypothetical protein
VSGNPVALWSKLALNQESTELWQFSQVDENIPVT